MENKRFFLVTIIIIASFSQFFLIEYPQVVAETNQPLANVHGLVLMTDGAEHSEYTYPTEFLEEFGCNIAVVAPKNSVTTSNNLVVEADFLIEEMNNVSDYDFLFVPGGASAGRLVEIPECLALVVEAFNSGLVMAAICAGPIVFVDAGIVSGYNISGNAAIATEVTAAGGNFIPDIIAIDRQFVTSDFPFMYTLAQQGILKALGLYETNPPEIITSTVNTLATGETESFSIILEMEDEYDIHSVKIEIMTNYENNTQSRYAYLQLYRSENLFTLVVDQLPIGNYSLIIIAEDVLGNVGTYALEGELIIRSVGLQYFSNIILIVSTSTFLVLLTRRKRR